MANWYLDSNHPRGTPNTGTSSTVWAASIAYAVGDRVIRLTGDAGLVYECTTGGTSGASEPTWDTDPVTPGTTTDNTVVWTTRNPQSWANAHPKLTFVDGLCSAGDNVFLQNSSSGGYSYGESQLAILDFNGTMGNPVRVFACKTGTSAEPPTNSDLVTNRDHSDRAQINSTYSGGGAITFQGCTYYYGIYFNASYVFNLLYNRAVSSWVVLEECVLKWKDGKNLFVGKNSTSATVVRSHPATLINCRIEIAGANQDIIVYDYGSFVWRGGELSAPVTPPTNLFDGTGDGHIYIEGVDLSDLGANSIYNTNNLGLRDLTIANCLIDANTSLISGTPADIGSVFRMHKCKAGTAITTPIPDFIEETYEGTVQDETAIYRTSGASDGSNNISMKMTPRTASTTKKVYQPLYSPWLLAKVDTTDASITVHLNIDRAAAIQDDECWIEVMIPEGSAGSGGSAQFTRYSSRVSLLGAPANLTADTEAWTGTGGWANEQKRKITYTFPANMPEFKGVARVRIAWAPESTDPLYVDAMAVLA